MICFLKGVCLIVLIHSGCGAGCDSCVDPHAVPDTFTVKTYQESNEHVENPHRGFIGHVATKSSHHTPLTKAYLDRLRSQSGLTMTFKTYELDTFKTSPISSDYLDKIRHDLDVIDSADFTIILRFCYVRQAHKSPPYGDASKNTVLHHISQLKPIFHQYERVITAIHAGFIGVWGEWHYTDHFGMPQNNLPGHDPETGLMPQALRDRKDVLLAMVHAAPKNVQVPIRIPGQKMVLVGSTPTVLQDVQRGEDKARIGHHNDCFLLSECDAGTYHNRAIEYPFLSRDTRYLVMGGETCGISQNHSHRYECPTATKELSMFHWTYLNQEFNLDVLNTWKRQGCYTDVHKRLGYRISVTKAILPNAAKVNDNLCFHLEFSNTGYAAPVKHLKFYFILQSTSGSSQHYAAQVTGVDVRDWQPGYTHTVASSLHLPHVPEGHYKVLVSLSDPLMGDRADYNVLLATTGVPLYTQGLNDLGHTVNIIHGAVECKEYGIKNKKGSH